jgi:sterol desaturase/sphingolipid hydroxylase (fatty acid hydroxylase superfamily)
MFEPGSIVALALAWGLFFAVTTAVLVGLGFAWERSAFGRRRRIFAMPVPAGQYRREALANLGFIALATASFTAAIAGGLLHADATGVVAAIVTFVVCFVGFEVYYYGQHRLLHTRALIRFHRWHHASRITTPLTGQSLGVVEALGWIGGLMLFPALLSGWGVLHAGALATYLVMNAVGNILGHANAEPHPRSSGTRANSWATHPFTFHALHHARWTGHYGFGTTVLDRVLGSEWSDWPALHGRVADGEPLRSFKQRGE